MKDIFDISSTTQNFGMKNSAKFCSICVSMIHLYAVCSCVQTVIFITVLFLKPQVSLYILHNLSQFEKHKKKVDLL